MNSRNWAIIVFVILGAFFLLGCQTEPKVGGMKIILNNTDHFPKELEGVWHEDDQNWEIKINSKGEVVSAVLGLATYEVYPDRVAKYEMKDGSEGYFKPGEWLLTYDANTRELTVQVVIIDFHLSMGSESLDGDRTEHFIGTVNKDMTLWSATHTTIPTYLANTEEGTDILDVQPEDFIRETTFVKRELKE